MCRKLEGLIMKDLGNNIYQYFRTVTFLFVIFVAAHMPAKGQIYFVNAYATSPDSLETPNSVNIVAINLNQKAIVNNMPIFDSGAILKKVPIGIPRGNNLFLISFSLDGAFAKNSSVTSDGSLLSYTISEYANEQLSIVRSGDFARANIDLLEQVPGETGFRLGVADDTGGFSILPAGLYTLNNNNGFRFLRNVAVDEIPGSRGNIDGFALLRRVWGADNYHLYHSFHNTQYWLVKLNGNLDAAIDSVQLRQSGGQATIYAFHPQRNKFYCFHLNYEMHGKFVTKNREDYYTDPEVLIYDPETLQLLERHYVTDYPEGNYPGKENGLADVMGDFIVYYFFEDDWMGIYAPAMLFIFDTRTNEATWLRVGWR
jgi:hypothetical protein